jgi:hypothetical protein
VLDDVQRRRFLVEPAREHPAPALVGAQHVDLDEGAGQFLLFPRRGRLARPQPNDHILPPRRLAGVERDRLDDAVALVEDPEHRHALRHRRHAAFAICSGCGLPPLGQRKIGFLTLAARSERDGGQQWCSQCAHAYSGSQGS